MSFTGKAKKPSSDDTISMTTKSVELNNCNVTEPSTSYEVFRNNTTAVEVIVKDVADKNKKKILLESSSSHQAIRRLQEEVESLQCQLANSNLMLKKNQVAFRLINLELKKQLDSVNRQELERQKDNLALLLENAKLKTLLELKINVATKFKRELNNMKRVLKMVIKNITFAPKVSENVEFNSDPEFDDFESDMKKDVHVKLASNLLDGVDLGGTLDSNISKDTKDSFDKHF